MIPLLAQVAQAAQSSSQGYLAIGIVVVALTAILQLAIAGKQLFGGNKGERKIEPTELHGITLELKTQTLTLNKLDREMGETKAGVKAVDDKISAQGEQVENAFRRINAISIESAAVSARLNDHLQDHREGRRNA